MPKSQVIKSLLEFLKNTIKIIKYLVDIDYSKTRFVDNIV